jgi:hypothetical protein
MPFRIQGNGGIVAGMDGGNSLSLRVTARPTNYGSLGMYSMGLGFDNVIAVDLPANSELLHFRWTHASNLCLVNHVNVSGDPVAQASTAVLLAFSLTVARAWTANGTGGTVITMGSKFKLRTSMGDSLVGQIRYASSGVGLGAGTKTLDATAIGAIAFSITTGTLSVRHLMRMTPPESRLLYSGKEGNHPLVLGTNEGFVLRSGDNAWPAGAVWIPLTNFSWGEVGTF